MSRGAKERVVRLMEFSVVKIGSLNPPIVASWSLLDAPATSNKETTFLSDTPTVHRLKPAALRLRNVAGNTGPVGEYHPLTGAASWNIFQSSDQNVIISPAQPPGFSSFNFYLPYLHPRPNFASCS